jgi:pimeloyl-ACP methyl ester carboxylesterase
MPPGAHYQFSDYLHDVEAALDCAGLARAHLVGHSLGGLVAAAYAAARPERVERLVMIDGLGPTLGAPDTAVQRLRGFLEDLHRPPRARPYASVEEAAARLRESNPSLSEAAALLLARHGTRPLPEGGVAFRFDPRHRRRFGFGLNGVEGDAQWLAILGAVRAPALLLRASQGLVQDDAVARARLAALRASVEVLEGGHHLHLDSPAPVAAALQRFLTLSAPAG